MKKLLLVLMVVAMASFLLVGCLPGMGVDDGDDGGDDDGLVEAAITFDKEYTNPSGVTFVPCEETVTVTFPSAVEVDYVVYVAVKNDVGGYQFVEPMDPNPDRTIWTIEGYTPLGCEETDKEGFVDPFCVDECEPICVAVLVKHPCCPGEEVDFRVVTIDCTPPELDLFVKFTDCEDECVIPDPCDPPVPGASMEWTSRTSDPCETLDCCEDTCSLVNGWSLVIDPDPCLGPCDTVPGTGCPVEGVLECGCLDYDDPATEANEGIHYVDFTFEDNVGNAVESTWKLTFDTDELLTFEKGYRNDDGDYVPTGDFKTPDADGWYQVYDMMDCPIF